MDYTSTSHLARIALTGAIDYIMKLGVDRILAHSQRLTEKLISGLQTMGSAEIVTPLTAEDRAGIVSAKFSGVTGVELMAEPRERGVIVAPRNGVIRFSVHMFNDETDIDRALNALADISAKRRKS